MEGEVGPQHSGFANPLYSQQDAAAAAAADDSDPARRGPATRTGGGFKPASWEPETDTLQLVERDTDD